MTDGRKNKTRQGRRVCMRFFFPEVFLVEQVRSHTRQRRHAAPGRHLRSSFRGAKLHTVEK